MIILYHGLPALTSNLLLLSSRQILDFRWVYYIALSETNQGVSLVYHPELVAVYHQHEVLYIIIAKVIQPSVDDIRLWRWYPDLRSDDMPLLSQWIKKYCRKMYPFLQYFLARPEGFEPTTNGIGIRYSIRTELRAEAFCVLNFDLLISIFSREILSCPCVILEEVKHR